MGFSAERQDQVQVVNVQFGTEAEEPQAGTAEVASEGLKPWMPYLRYGVAMLLFAVILLFVVRPLLAMLGTNIEQAQAEASVAELAGGTAAGGATLANTPDRAQIIDMAKKP